MAQYEVNIDVANATKQEMVGIMKTENPRILNRAGACYMISLMENEGHRCLF